MQREMKPGKIVIACLLMHRDVVQSVGSYGILEKKFN